ncbi:MAG: AzlD domain-containing protein [Clostridia bacterium]|nr:AzlD domain-containing protein [Clostridia bacterium]
MRIFIYIAVMALVTYLIRMIPFTVFRKQIKSPFLKSLFFYLPYAVLAAMTFPAVFYATGNRIAAIAGTAVALILAFFNAPLLVVAVAAAVVALIFGILL